MSVDDGNNSIATASSFFHLILQVVTSYISKNSSGYLLRLLPNHEKGLNPNESQLIPGQLRRGLLPIKPLLLIAIRYHC